MVRRILLGSALSLLAGFCLLIFEAAAQTSIALELIARAGASPSASVRAALLQRAETGISRSWARPALWHAGASEALSGAAYARALEAEDAQALRASAAAAERTVRLAPVQPNSWIRLAALAERGVANSLCDVESCLARSWQAAPLLDGAGGCERLRIAHRAGLLAAGDSRLVDYANIAGSRRTAAACLNFLAPAELYEVMMQSAAS